MRLIGRFISFAPLIIFFLSLTLFISFFKIKDYVLGNTGSDVIAKYYADPQQIYFKAHNPKNLVLIYVESLEKTYSDKEIFGADLLHSLNSQSGAHVDHFIQMPGATWTMGGIVSSQCGLPLKTMGLGDGNSQGRLYKSFLPGAICLGDVLKDLGYQNVFLGGASLRFSGKGKFFSGHGYQKVMGKLEWLSSGRYHDDDLNGWGLYDKDIFSEAKSQLDLLENEKKPFNLTVLTVDTHFPAGFLSDQCRARKNIDDEKNIEASIQCTAETVADFVSYARSKGYLRNTNIVIMGDHLLMASTISDKLRKAEKREIYNKWISERAVKFNRPNIDHFDIAPTILDFIGVEVAGARFGLGYSALTKEDVVPSKGYYDEFLLNLNSKSPFYAKFWVAH
jgi:phosphoglycerol transferase